MMKDLNSNSERRILLVFMSSSRVSGTAAKLWHEPIRSEADGSELTRTPQTGIHSPIGLAEDALRSVFGSASQ